MFRTKPSSFLRLRPLLCSLAAALVLTAPVVRAVTPFTAAAPMSQGRAGPIAAVLADGKVLVAGGYGNNATLLTSAEVYDPVSATWSPTGTMNAGRSVFVAATLPNGRVLVIGGLQPGPGYDAAEIYDPAQGTWASAGRTGAGSSPTATLLPGGDVLAFGANLRVGGIFNHSSLTWSPTKPSFDGRYYHVAVALANGKVLVAGGIAGPQTATTNTAEIYDPASGNWSWTGSLNDGRIYAAAVRLLDGRVLLCGGDDYEVTGQAEIYDPATEVWSVTAPMSVPRSHHTLTLLASGKVLATGGNGSSSGGPVLASAELYDPSTQTWVPAGTMTEPRANATASNLPDGRVLIAGGGDSITEIYDPSAPTPPPAPPSITVDLADAFVFAGGSVSLHVESSDPGPLSYQWTQVSDSGVTTYAAAPQYGPPSSITLYNVTSSGRYQAMVTSAKGTSRTRLATVTVVPLPAAADWHSAALASTPYFNPGMVVAGAGKLVALGAGGSGPAWATSINGQIWTLTPNAPPAAANISSLVFGNGLFVCVGALGNIYTSLDGITWIAREAGAPTLNLKKVVAGNGGFYALGSALDGTNSSETLLTSPDGIRWTHNALPSPGASLKYSDVAAGNNRVICVARTSTSTVCEVSTDLSTWTATTTSLNTTSLVYGNGVFVRDDATSVDGLTWSPRGTTYGNLSFTGGIFTSTFAVFQIPVSQSPTTVWVSTDGVAWQQSSSSLYGVTVGPIQALNGGFIMYGGTTVDLYTTSPVIYYTGTLAALPPTVDTQPVSALVTPRQAVTLSIAASGGGNLTYQWYQGSSGDVSHPIAGATSASLTPTPLVQTTSYWARATNESGTADSNTATITISTAFISGGGAVFQGQPASFNYNDSWVSSARVPADHLIYGSVPVTYQWQHNNTDMPGQTASSLTLPSVISTDAGTYRVVVTNASGSLASDAVTLSVQTPAATVFQTQPVGGTIYPGQTLILNALATGEGTVNYQWYAGLSGDVSHPVGGAVLPSFTPAPPTSSSSYWVRASALGGTADSTTAALNLNTTLPTVTGDGLLSQPMLAKFQLQNLSNGPATYQWQKDSVDIPGATGTVLTFTVSGPADAGAYRAVITTGGGVITSSAQPLVYLNGLTLNGSKSIIGTVAPGGSAVMDLDVTGQAVTYEWAVFGGASLVDGGRWTGTHSRTLGISPVQAGDQGQYVCKVYSNGVLTGQSGLFSLTVSLPQPPAFTVQPVSTTVYPNQTASISAMATGPGTISYQWYAGQVGDVTHPVAGATSTAITVGPLTAASSFWVRATNVGGHADSNTATVTVTIARPVVTFDAGSAWMVRRFVHAAVKAPGATSYQVTGLPKGLVLSQADGSITGQPVLAGLYPLRITARNAQGLSDPVNVTMVVAQLNVNVQGNFSGLVERDVVANSLLGGRVNMTFTSAGTFTGSLSLGNAVFPVTGSVLETLDDGSLRGGASLSSKGYPWIYFVVHADSATLTGNVYLTSSSSGASVPCRAVQNIWSARGVRPSAYMGVYTAAMQLPAGVLANAAYPQGTGYFGGGVNGDGSVTMSARLADNTVVTATTALGPDLSVPIHWLLYGGTGSAQGWQSVKADAGLGALMDGSISWMKLTQPTKSTTRSYKAGFPLHELNTVGSILTVPGSGVIELGLPNQPGNAVATFSQGGLSSNRSEVLQITQANAAVLQRGSPLTMTIDKTQGKFSGNYSVGGIVAPYFGIFLPRLGLGLGHFQLPQSNAATSAILSGSVVLGGAK